MIVVHDDEKGRAERPDWIPSGTDMCRSWGIYQAWETGTRYTVTLDDDVRPFGPDIFAEYERDFERGAVLSPYLSVGDLTSAGMPLRGFPYGDRAPADVVVQYGGWHGVLDFDAATQLVDRPSMNHKFAPVSIPVPRGVPATTCIMNAAWQTWFAPFMWQLPMREGRYNRFGDIWSGLLQKKLLDAFDRVMLINGAASVFHERASDVFKSLEREAPGIAINERVWDALATFDMTWEPSGDMPGAYRALIEILGVVTPPDYREYLMEVSERWLDLFV